MRPSRSASPAQFRRFLRTRHLLFACAESCTGGLLSRQMTAAAGASEVFWGGVTTYSNEAKTTLLGVPAALILDEGAVSGAVALAMVQGLAARSAANLTVSVTGVAGPSGGTPEKPVGTVWFGLQGQGKGSASCAVRLQLGGTRREIQADAASWARTLAVRWWESGMELDSLLSLTNNIGKVVVEAFLPPSSPQTP